MRDLRFRAWHHGAGDPRVTPFMRHSEPFNVLFWQNVETDDLGVEVMQFTGLTDKNGVDIYEGDIVEEERLLSNGKVYAHLEVKYKAPSFKVGDLALSTYMGISWKVIGNIHQNPELLK